MSTDETWVCCGHTWGWGRRDDFNLGLSPSLRGHLDGHLAEVLPLRRPLQLHSLRRLPPFLPPPAGRRRRLHLLLPLLLLLLPSFLWFPALPLLLLRFLLLSLLFFLSFFFHPGSGPSSTSILFITSSSSSGVPGGMARDVIGRCCGTHRVEKAELVLGAQDQLAPRDRG